MTWNEGGGVALPSGIEIGGEGSAHLLVSKSTEEEVSSLLRRRNKGQQRWRRDDPSSTHRNRRGGGVVLLASISGTDGGTLKLTGTHTIANSVGLMR